MRVSRVASGRSKAVYRLQGCSSRLVIDWHFKVGRRSDRDCLRRAAALASALRGYVPVPISRYLPVPFLPILATRTVPGLDGATLADVIGPRKAVEAFSAVPERLEALQVDLPVFEQVDGGHSSEEVDLSHRWNVLKRDRRLHPAIASLSIERVDELLHGDLCGGTSAVAVHGDLFLSNLIFSSAGELRGVIDLDTFGLGCRVLDAAILSWSVEISMGKVWAQEFLRLVGRPDADHVLLHRLLFDLEKPEGADWSWIDHPPVAARRHRLSSSRP